MRPERIRDVAGHAGSRFGGVEVLVNKADYGNQSSVQKGEAEATRSTERDSSGCPTSPGWTGSA